MSMVAVHFVNKTNYNDFMRFYGIYFKCGLFGNFE